MSLERTDYPAYLERLEAASGRKIHDFSSLLDALRVRMDFFASMGCVTADHGLPYVPYVEASRKEVETIFSWRLAGRMPEKRELAAFRTAFLAVMGREYHKRGWVMQLHFGVKRDNSSRLYAGLGPDAGADCILSPLRSGPLADYLNALDRTRGAAKDHPLFPESGGQCGHRRSHWLLSGRRYPGEGTAGKCLVVQ